MQDMTTKGRHVGSARITAEDAKKIRELNASGRDISALSKKYSLSTMHVNNILWGKFWPNAGGPIIERKPRYSTRITQELANKIAKMKKRGSSAEKVAKKFNVGATTVYQIAAGTYQVRY